MSATPSSPAPARPRSGPAVGPATGSAARLLIGAWVVFAAINLWLMFLLPGSETIPFHLIWFSLSLLYGYVVWPLRAMVLSLLGVTVFTLIALVHHAQATYIGYEETAEVPLMAAIFFAMAWHVRRRQAALGQVERLAAADRERADAQRMFVRLASHEMRTPVTVSRGYTELIRTAHDDPQTAEDTGIVLEELDRLDRSVSRLVTLMALDSEPALEPVDVDQLLEHTVRRWAPTADRTWLVDSRIGVAVVDLQRTQTALDCLLDNAVKFTAAGDTVALRGRHEAGHLVVEIADEGAGIPEDDLPHVFDTFRTGSNSGERGGTGLGLSIVRKVVEARGGSVGVRSEVGAGTTFTIRVPAIPTAGVAAAALVPWPRTP